MEIIDHPNTGYESMPDCDMLNSDDIFIGKGTELLSRVLIDEKGISPFQDQYEDKNPSAC